MRPFEGIRIIDATHVLAGPFATYQMALLGADVIKIEDPNDPDQSRTSGNDQELSNSMMGTYFLTQGSNKRSLTIDLKSEKGRLLFKKLVATSDILIENYRPGAFDDMGLGYEEMIKIQPKLIYCSVSAFGHGGKRREQTAYDFVIQAASGLMAMTGTPEVNPIKFGSPAVDYATGTMAAFALSSALFQRTKTNTSQHIDLAMYDVALLLASTNVTSYLRNGKPPKPNGNDHPHATNCCYQTLDGLLMIGASNIRQQARLWKALGRLDMVKINNNERDSGFIEEKETLKDLLINKTAIEWEEFFIKNKVPASRVRTLPEALADTQLDSRNLLHKHENANGIKGEFSVPVSAFKFSHGGAKVTSPPPVMGVNNKDILIELGYSSEEIDALKANYII